VDCYGKVEASRLVSVILNRDGAYFWRVNLVNIHVAFDRAGRVPSALR
jgi:hypothetical protein